MNDWINKMEFLFKQMICNSLKKKDLFIQIGGYRKLKLKMKEEEVVESSRICWNDGRRMKS